MTKDSFKELFEVALEVAAKNAENRLGRVVPRTFAIEMHGLDVKPRTLTTDEALDEIYLGSDNFYRVIDLAVRSVSGTTTTVFMRVSGHRPGSFSDTWNRPSGSGPFKQLIANEIEVREDP